MSLWTKRSRNPALGALERAVLDAVWRLGETDAQALLERFSQQRAIALSTVQSTLERLHRKQLLRRRKAGRSFLYCAQLSRDDLIGRMVSEIANELSVGRPAAAISGLLDLAQDADEASLRRLEAWIAAARAQRDGTTEPR